MGLGGSHSFAFQWSSNTALPLVVYLLYLYADQSWVEICNFYFYFFYIKLA